MRPPANRPDPHGEGEPDTRLHLLVYDGGCGMCHRWVDRLRRWDRHGVLEFAPYQDPAVGERLPGIPGSALREAVHLVAPDGSTWRGAEVAEQLASLLPGWGPLALLFRIPLVRPVADAVYRWVARNRGSPGCSAHG